MKENNKRCLWGISDSRMMAYHDTEWGFPTYDSQKLFEYLILEIMQAGLSWSTILNKRKAFKKAFSNFEIEQVSKYDNSDLERLLSDASIVRNRLKISAIINNAQIISQFDSQKSFSDYWWHFFASKPLDNQCQVASDVPSQTDSSRAVSKQMQHDGFKFVGPTIIYSFMQASGVVNDHLVTCPTYLKIHLSVSERAMS